METYEIKAHLNVFGVEVKNFRAGIGEAFDALLKMVGGFDRSFYGISQMTNSGFSYYATALESYKGEAEKYNCKRLVIEKGEYLTVEVRDWRKSTDTIKDVFQVMLQDSRTDRKAPCVEWYKNEVEMVCMVKMK